jgi:hypothetical protein
MVKQVDPASPDPAMSNNAVKPALKAWKWKTDVLDKLIAGDEAYAEAQKRFALAERYERSIQDRQRQFEVRLGHANLNHLALARLDDKIDGYTVKAANKQLTAMKKLEEAAGSLADALDTMIASKLLPASNGRLRSLSTAMREIEHECNAAHEEVKTRNNASVEIIRGTKGWFAARGWFAPARAVWRRVRPAEKTEQELMLAAAATEAAGLDRLKAAKAYASVRPYFQPPAAQLKGCNS